MGIKDLLKFMKPYIQPIHIKKYAGKRVGIDAYSWLHKGAYSCSMELCLDSKSETKWRYIDYFMHRINLLRFYEITPIVVFDGGSIPCKSATEHERLRRRKANCESAMAKLEEGDVNAATELIQKAVNVTPSMAHQLIQILRSENIEFVVAPYEADAQLAYLSSLEADKGGIAAVVTEDSDLVAYGCQAIVFKMDRFGDGQEILLHNVFDSASCSPSFRGFNKELFIGMCVLAGCDFLPSVPGIGIAKAYSLVSKYRNLDRVLSVLKIEKSRQMPEDYSKYFREAIAVFQHARIYDIESKMIKHMKPLSQRLLRSLDGELDFMGPETPPSVATAIAEGKLDPTNMQAFGCSLSSQLCSYPVVVETRRVQKPITAAAPRSERSNAVFSLQNVSKDFKGQVQKQDDLSTESRYLNEGVALEKLIMPSDNHGKVETMNNISWKIPNNNPFKRKNADACKLKERLSSVEEISFVAGNESQEILCVEHDEILSKIHVNHSSRKRKHKEIRSDHSDSNGMQPSVITKEENLDKMKVENTDHANGSQESINSKPKIQKSKRSNANDSANKKSSILNFFSPL